MRYDTQARLSAISLKYMALIYPCVGLVVRMRRLRTLLEVSQMLDTGARIEVRPYGSSPPWLSQACSTVHIYIAGTRSRGDVPMNMPRSDPTVTSCQ